VGPLSGILARVTSWAFLGGLGFPVGLGSVRKRNFEL
jgi:hypothetical protein